MTESNPIYEIDKLSSMHNKKDFSSGSVFLDNYLKNQAGQDIKRNISVTYVMTKCDCKNVIGYYTISSISIDISEMPDEYIKKLPKYPTFPAVLLGRLAVDLKFQKKKLGEYLLVDALKRSLLISNQLGVHAIIVDAKDDAAVNFYLRYGFLKFKSYNLKLFMTIKVITSLEKVLLG